MTKVRKDGRSPRRRPRALARSLFRPNEQTGCPKLRILRVETHYSKPQIEVRSAHFALGKGEDITAHGRFEFDGGSGVACNSSSKRRTRRPSLSERVFGVEDLKGYSTTTRRSRRSLSPARRSAPPGTFISPSRSARSRRPRSPRGADASSGIRAPETKRAARAL